MIMTQNDKDLKELLLKDLCARLPYGVKVSCYDLDEEILKCDTLEGVERSFVTVDGFQREITDIKPYLFPLSSMTDEQKEEMVNKGIAYYQVFDGIGRRFFFKEGYELYDWLNKNHFDYRGLIEKSLAIDATNLEIYK